MSKGLGHSVGLTVPTLVNAARLDHATVAELGAGLDVDRQVHKGSSHVWHVEVAAGATVHRRFGRNPTLKKDARVDVDLLRRTR